MVHKGGWGEGREARPPAAPFCVCMVHHLSKGNFVRWMGVGLTCSKQLSYQADFLFLLFVTTSVRIDLDLCYRKSSVILLRLTPLLLIISSRFLILLLFNRCRQGWLGSSRTTTTKSSLPKILHICDTLICIDTY